MFKYYIVCIFFSGGHFNPAVTLGVTLSGGLPLFLAPGYMIGQVIGGILGAALVRVCIHFSKICILRHSSILFTHFLCFTT